MGEDTPFDSFLNAPMNSEWFMISSTASRRALMASVSRRGWQSQTRKSRLPNGVTHFWRSEYKVPSVPPSELTRTYGRMHAHIVSYHLGGAVQERGKRTSMCARVFPLRTSDLLARMGS